MKSLATVTKGFSVLVDDDVYEWVSTFRWYVLSKNCTYVVRPRGKNEINGPRTIYLHREILSAKPNEEVDHINRDKLDNRRENLRICSHQENLRNRNSGKRRNGGSLRGASWSRSSRRWRADITVDGAQEHIGMFKTELEAHKKYTERYKEIYGTEPT